MNDPMSNPTNQRDEEVPSAEDWKVAEEVAKISCERHLALIFDSRKTIKRGCACQGCYEWRSNIASTLTSLRQSWEREKAVLEDKLSHALYQSESWMKSNAGQCARADKAEAEKKGLEEQVRLLCCKNECTKTVHVEGCIINTNSRLEERVRELEIKLLIAQEKTERVRDEWREAKNGFLITDNVKAQELTRLKSRNEELEAENLVLGNLKDGFIQSLKAENESLIDEIKEVYIPGSMQAKEKIDRLTSALARAHEALADSLGWVKILHNESAFKSSSTELAISSAEKALADPSGSLAFEKWKKMGAVVEAGKNLYEHRSWESEEVFRKALEALDAKGASDV